MVGPEAPDMWVSEQRSAALSSKIHRLARVNLRATCDWHGSALRTTQLSRYHLGMDDRTLIAELGVALWGAVAWKSRMAEALEQREALISDWADGKAVVPAGIWKELREVTRLHYLKLADFDPQIVRAYDAAVVREGKGRR